MQFPQKVYIGDTVRHLTTGTVGTVQNVKWEPHLRDASGRIHSFGFWRVVACGFSSQDVEFSRLED